jgi:Ca2+-binding EF-hand superfamily protein
MRLSAPLSAVILTTAPLLHAAPTDKARIKQFTRLDRDHNDQLDRNELAKILPAQQTRNGALAETREVMFAWFDVDASDGIDLGEWLDGQISYGFAQPSFSSGTFAELDANDDGSLQWLEFSRVIAKYVPASTARQWHVMLTSADTSPPYGSSAIFQQIDYSNLSLSLSGGTLTLTNSNGAVSNSIDLTSTYTGTTTVSHGILTTSGSTSDPETAAE